MSVDAEIQKVQDALARVHQTFYDLAFGMKNITAELDAKLSVFNQEVQGVEHEVALVRSGVLTVTDSFPNRTSYMVILLVIDFIIWILAGFLLYKIVQNCRFGPKNSTKMISKYEKLMNKQDKKDTVPVYSPPPEYYAITVDMDDEMEVPPSEYQNEGRHWNILMPKTFWKKNVPVDAV
ncbi:unnamed protein product [Bursaphelenchus okinawaensis]|uniref:Uncharacterized protein n=1 Tax=Bursaphelenchus okinawaensis TaxID=465554 RepID=A0A811L9R1_9BILA|nr:unnamed protein product [Bursaphelenchus okinawaensis]CAG9119402.1 unnamed protein product [Bursaphelenchus okinawaensis]